MPAGLRPVASLNHIRAVPGIPSRFLPPGYALESARQHKLKTKLKRPPQIRNQVLRIYHTRRGSGSRDSSLGKRMAYGPNNRFHVTHYDRDTRSDPWVGKAAFFRGGRLGSIGPPDERYGKDEHKQPPANVKNASSVNTIKGCRIGSYGSH